MWRRAELATLLGRAQRQALSALLAVVVVSVGVLVAVLAGTTPRITRAGEALQAVHVEHEAMVDQETGLRGYLAGRDTALLQPYEAGRAALPPAEQVVRRGVAGDRGLEGLAAQVDAGERDWSQRWAAVTLASPPDLDDRAATVRFLLSGKQLFDAYRGRQAALEQALVARRDAAQRLQDWLLGLGTLVDLLVCGLLALRVLRSTSRLREVLVPPVRAVRATLAALRERRPVEPLVPDGPAELASIAADVNHLAQALDEERTRVVTRERELVRAREEALAAGAAKASFLATMSHEIRTPLNAVIGMADLLLDTQLRDDQRDYLSTIARSGDSLLAVVNDILDFSRIEAGGLDLEQAPFDLAELVHGTVAVAATGRVGASPVGAAGAVELLVEVSEPPGQVPVGDAARLRQVLLNLVSNAVKFTAAGEVAVTARLRASGGDGELVLSVRDTGIGISAEALGRLFEPFTQADASTTRTYGGTGLGLAISRRIARAMGGDVTVTSEPGRGSTFTLTAPVRVEVDRAPSGQQPPLGGRHVLVVDDNLTNQRILRDQLVRAGARCTTVSSAGQALALLLGIDGHQVDAAVVDLHMPGTDGVQLAEQLHRLVERPVPMVLLSSVTPSGSAAALFAARLRKPAHPAQLVQALLHAMPGVAAPDDATRAPRPAAPGRRLTVLIAEDHPVNQKLSVLLVQRLGHDAELVADGAAAVAAVASRNGPDGHDGAGDLPPYDVVLMDGQMPVMDGYDATRTLRSLPVAQPRVVAVTASVGDEDVDRFLAAGADDVCAKPLRLQALADALRSAVPVHGRRPAPELDDPVLDDAVLDDLQALGADSVVMLVSSFLEALPDAVARLREAAAAGSPVDRLAHQLKGSSSVMAARTVAEVCEHLCRPDLAPAERDRLVAELEEQARAAAAALDEVLAAARRASA